MKNIIDRFEFEVEELNQEVSGKKENGITTRYIRPLINVFVTVKDTDLSHEIEEYSFCSEIITETSSKNITKRTVTEFYLDNDDISDELKTDLIHTVVSDYRLFEETCTFDNETADTLALAQFFGIKQPHLSDAIVNQYNYLKLNYKFVSKLLENEVLTEKDLEKLMTL